MEGMEGEELREVTGLTKIAFASKRRLIRRRVEKAFPDGWIAMTSPADKDEDALARLSQALAEDILAASDESILGEVKDDGGDPAAIAAATRALFEQAAVASNKALLADAKAAVAADRRPSAGVVQLDAAAARTPARPSAGAKSRYRPEAHDGCPQGQTRRLLG